MYWEKTRSVGNGLGEVLLSMFQEREAFRKYMGNAGRREQLECGQRIYGGAKAETSIPICAYSGRQGAFSFIFH